MTQLNLNFSVNLRSFSDLRHGQVSILVCLHHCLHPFHANNFPKFHRSPVGLVKRTGAQRRSRCPTPPCGSRLGSDSDRCSTYLTTPIAWHNLIQVTLPDRLPPISSNHEKCPSPSRIGFQQASGYEAMLFERLFECDQMPTFQPRLAAMAESNPRRQVTVTRPDIHKFSSHFTDQIEPSVSSTEIYGHERRNMLVMRCIFESAINIHESASANESHKNTSIQIVLKQRLYFDSYSSLHEIGTSAHCGRQSQPPRAILFRNNITQARKHK